MDNTVHPSARVNGVWGSVDLQGVVDNDGAAYYVPVPRVPCIGESFRGPDDGLIYTVVSVVYEYDDGFYYPPTKVVVRVVRT